jgi:hypothetical protein
VENLRLVYRFKITTNGFVIFDVFYAVPGVSNGTMFSQSLIQSYSPVALVNTDVAMIVGMIVGFDDGNAVGVLEDRSTIGTIEGVLVGVTVICFVGIDDGVSESLVVGNPEGSSVICMLGSNVGLPDGFKVPISLLMTSSAVLQIVIRLSSTKGDWAGSMPIPASGPTQQFGIFNTNEQKQDPKTKFDISGKGRLE